MSNPSEIDARIAAAFDASEDVETSEQVRRNVIRPSEDIVYEREIREDPHAGSNEPIHPDGQ